MQNDQDDGEDFPDEILMDWILDLEDLTLCLLAKRKSPIAHIMDHLNQYWEESPYLDYKGRKVRFNSRFPIRHEDSITFDEEREYEFVRYLVPALIYKGQERSNPSACQLCEDALIRRIDYLLDHWREPLEGNVSDCPFVDLDWVAEWRRELTKLLHFRHGTSWSELAWLTNFNRSIQGLGLHVLQLQEDNDSKLKAAPNEQSLTEHYVEIAKSEAAKLIQITTKTLRRRMLDGTYDATELNKNVIRINKRHLPS